jgi:hypothetical protein
MTRMRPGGAAAVAVCLALALAIVALSEVGKSRHPPFGFNDNAVTEHVATPAQTAALLARIGARIDRVQVNWRSIEPSPGNFQLSVYDQIYAADLARGVKPLWIFAFAPQWAAQAPCVASVDLCPPAPAALGQAAAAAAELARRYPKAAGIEIWNEPNTPGFWFGGADPAAYTRLLIACNEAIKRADPSMPVAGGSLSDTPYTTRGYLSLQAFLGHIYRDGGGHYMDAISIHPYPVPGDLSGSSAVAAVQQAIAARDAAGGASTPIWVTETGISSTGPGAVSEVEQASALVRLYERLAAIAAVRMIIFHTLVPPPGAADATGTGFAVLRPNLSPKPAFCALSAMLRGHSQC